MRSMKARIAVVALPALLIGSVGYAAPAAQEQAAQEAREAARQSGNAVKDSWVTMKIHSSFVPEDALEGSDIDVDTNAGVVTLTGTVPTAAAKTRAVAIAKATDGVKSVTDQLRVAADADVASARESGREAAQETREAGRQTADATREAGREARETVGTAGRTVTDGWIKSKIYSQYITEDALDDAEIDVDITKGVVTLNGTVPTEAAKARAGTIAKGTEGVKNVNNKLQVAK
jgi:hyperosmotically inducible protein